MRRTIIDVAWYVVFTALGVWAFVGTVVLVTR